MSRAMTLVVQTNIMWPMSLDWAQVLTCGLTNLSAWIPIPMTSEPSKFHLN